MATDSHGRRIDYLRISVTDRCNLRCVYCMPPDGVPWKGHEEILSWEEIERFAAVAAGEGISKIRLTGGEPLVRAGIVEHVRRLRAVTGIESIAITTNGTLLPKYAAELVEAGLTRVNISLDTLDAETYTNITRGGKLDDVLAGIEAAFDAGMDPVKINVVVVRSLEQDLLGFARMTLDRPVHVRFIEYMPVGGAEDGVACASTEGEGWTEADHVPSDETLAMLSAGGAAAGFGELAPVARDDAPGGWGPAHYYRFPGAKGTLGVISPLSHHFCGECNRLRLTADGRLRTCLFSDDELDVRTILRTGTEADIHELIQRALAAKPESHNMRVGTLRRMSQIGG
ncbi:MAG: GTP 3',8-cyclase MoaA [Actinobacteria bacterium HGW-Actinobacteria-6]|nr:MAG: GTP 3',8-cyclase MoaA [Actinobacteria bacterium HGW-Actinobacteria-6]